MESMNKGRKEAFLIWLYNQEHSNLLIEHDEFFRVSQCKSAKDMQNVLEVTHERTNDEKRARKHALI